MRQLTTLEINRIKLLTENSVGVSRPWEALATKGCSLHDKGQCGPFSISEASDDDVHALCIACRIQVYRAMARCQADHLAL